MIKKRAQNTKEMHKNHKAAAKINFRENNNTTK